VDNRLKLWLLPLVILAHLGLLAWIGRPGSSQSPTTDNAEVTLLELAGDGPSSPANAVAKVSQLRQRGVQPNPLPQPSSHSVAAPGSALAGLLDAEPPVEVPASPVIDWVITRGALPPNQKLTLRFTVWVNAAGEIDRFEIDPAQRDVPWANQALSSLLLTPMQPATRDGEPVASTMMVELQIDTSPASN
jgi:hypothetical protein